jgi:hypothetical protein
LQNALQEVASTRFNGYLPASISGAWLVKVFPIAEETFRMTGIRHLCARLTFVIVLTTLGACAGGGRGEAERLNSLIGKANKTYFVEKLGPPDKQAAIEPNTEVWEYRLDEQKFTSQTGYRFSTFKRLRLTFRDGTLVSWNQSDETQ